MTLGEYLTILDWTGHKGAATNAAVSPALCSQFSSDWASKTRTLGWSRWLITANRSAHLFYRAGEPARGSGAVSGRNPTGLRSIPESLV